MSEGSSRRIAVGVTSLLEVCADLRKRIDRLKDHIPQQEGDLMVAMLDNALAVDPLEEENRLLREACYRSLMSLDAARGVLSGPRLEQFQCIHVGDRKALWAALKLGTDGYGARDEDEEDAEPTVEQFKNVLGNFCDYDQEGATEGDWVPVHVHPWHLRAARKLLGM